MSLASLVLRHLTVLALTDATLAGKQVRSSLLVPIEDLQRPEDEAAIPMIAVFTDQTDAGAADVHGLALMEAQTTVTLALEIACIAAAPAKDGSGVDTFIPQTDEGMEMTLDLIHRQAMVALQAGSSQWSDLWRTLACRAVKLKAVRGASIENGIRFAARRIEIDLQPLAEPVPGAPVVYFWNDLLAAFAADPRTSDFEPILRAAVSSGTLPDYRQVQQRLGLTNVGIAAMGIAPIEGSTISGSVTVATGLIAENADQHLDITVTADGATLKAENDDAVALSEAADE